MTPANQAATAARRPIICNQAVTGTSAQNGTMFRVQMSRSDNENLVHSPPLSRRKERGLRLFRAEGAQHLQRADCGLQNESGDPPVPAFVSIFSANAERSR